MKNNLLGLTNAEMHAEIAIALRDPIVRDHAAMMVEAMVTVNGLVPDANRHPTDPYLRHAITDLAGQPLPHPWLDRDPMYITERDRLMRPIVAAIPTAPTHGHCARCQPWEAEFDRLLFDVTPKKRLRAVRFVRYTVVVEFLLCQECVETLGVEPS